MTIDRIFSHHANLYLHEGDNLYLTSCILMRILQTIWVGQHLTIPQNITWNSLETLTNYRKIIVCFSDCYIALNYDEGLKTIWSNLRRCGGRQLTMKRCTRLFKTKR
jgi:hypothetical protein